MGRGGAASRRARAFQFAPQWLIGIEGDIARANKSVTAAGIPGCALPVANSCVTGAGLAASPGPGVDLSSVALGSDVSLTRQTLP
jgi:hypothetical protein